MFCSVLLLHVLAHAQGAQVPGHPIGKVTTDGDLIVLELDQGALGKTNLFDLAGRTLVFIPEGAGYRVENRALEWDADFGPEATDPEVTLHKFAFPFSGKSWNSLSVGTTGSIRFGPQEAVGGPGLRGPARAGGVSIARFDQLGEAAGTLINTVPAICVFFKPRMLGAHYEKELADRVVITWDLTEPFGNIQDFTWFKTVNRFQATLHRNGSIEMSYKELAAKDAIVGVFPLLSKTEERPLAVINFEPHSAAAAYVDLRKVRLDIVDGLFLKVTFETRGPVLTEGDSALPGVAYRLYFDTEKPPPTRTEAAHPSVIWAVRGVAPPGRGGSVSRYVAFGQGVSRNVTVTGNRISVQGILPTALRGVEQVAVSAEVLGSGNQSEAGNRPQPYVVRMSGICSPEVHFSSLTRNDGPFAVVYESFHYLALPNPRDCRDPSIGRVRFIKEVAVLRSHRAKLPAKHALPDVPVHKWDLAPRLRATAQWEAMSRGLGKRNAVWKATAVREDFSGGSTSRSMKAPIRCRRGRPRTRQSGTIMTSRFTGTNSENDRPTGRCRRTSIQCRRSGMKWGIAGPHSYPRR